jgi:ATP-dependent exoDNAse (exonuclease V) beta subunit
MSRMPLAHLAIRASAGSGKTHQLTNRYLLLLAEGVEPEAILATTFTRKAAAEILDRVLDRLAAAAGDAGKARELVAQL